ncbi:MAG: leucine-rich repeat domain-containing protein [Christensenellaceae bacterium]|jgi:hypothetical protein|nr:leucine-rich repeat domain-containing protein [Christensenellaceae bacterium]
MGLLQRLKSFFNKRNIWLTVGTAVALVSVAFLIFVILLPAMKPDEDKDRRNYEREMKLFLDDILVKTLYVDDTVTFDDDYLNANFVLDTLYDDYLIQQGLTGKPYIAFYGWEYENANGETQQILYSNGAWEVPENMNIYASAYYAIVDYKAISIYFKETSTGSNIDVYNPNTDEGNDVFSKLKYPAPIYKTSSGGNLLLDRFDCWILKGDKGETKRKYFPNDVIEFSASIYYQSETVAGNSNHCLFTFEPQFYPSASARNYYLRKIGEGVSSMYESKLEKITPNNPSVATAQNPIVFDGNEFSIYSDSNVIDRAVVYDLTTNEQQVIYSGSKPFSVEGVGSHLHSIVFDVYYKGVLDDRDETLSTKVYFDYGNDFGAEEITANIFDTINLADARDHHMQGYYFYGWLSSVGNSHRIYLQGERFRVPVTPKGKITFTAIWNKNALNFLLDLNGGEWQNEPEMSSMLGFVGDTVRITPTEPVRFGYFLHHWQTDDGESYAPNAEITVGGETRWLTAVWEKQNIILQYTYPVFDDENIKMYNVSVPINTNKKIGETLTLASPRNVIGNYNIYIRYFDFQYWQIGEDLYEQNYNLEFSFEFMESLVQTNVATFDKLNFYIKIDSRQQSSIVKITAHIQNPNDSAFTDETAEIFAPYWRSFYDVLGEYTYFPGYDLLGWAFSPNGNIKIGPHSLVGPDSPSVEIWPIIEVRKYKILYADNSYSDPNVYYFYNNFDGLNYLYPLPNNNVNAFYGWSLESDYGWSPGIETYEYEGDPDYKYERETMVYVSKLEADAKTIGIDFQKDVDGFYKIRLYPIFSVSEVRLNYDEMYFEPVPLRNSKPTFSPNYLGGVTVGDMQEQYLNYGIKTLDDARTGFITPSGKTFIGWYAEQVSHIGDARFTKKFNSQFNPGFSVTGEKKIWFAGDYLPSINYSVKFIPVYLEDLDNPEDILYISENVVEPIIFNGHHIVFAANAPEITLAPGVLHADNVKDLYLPDNVNLSANPMGVNDTRATIGKSQLMRFIVSRSSASFVRSSNYLIDVNNGKLIAFPSACDTFDPAGISSVIARAFVNISGLADLDLTGIGTVEDNAIFHSSSLQTIKTPNYHAVSGFQINLESINGKGGEIVDGGMLVYVLNNFEEMYVDLTDGIVGVNNYALSGIADMEHVLGIKNETLNIILRNQHFGGAQYVHDIPIFVASEEALSSYNRDAGVGTAQMFTKTITFLLDEKDPNDESDDLVYTCSVNFNDNILYFEPENEDDNFKEPIDKKWFVFYEWDNEDNLILEENGLKITRENDDYLISGATFIASWDATPIQFYGSSNGIDYDIELCKDIYLLQPGVGAVGKTIDDLSLNEDQTLSVYLPAVADEYDGNTEKQFIYWTALPNDEGQIYFPDGKSSISTSRVPTKEQIKHGTSPRKFYAVYDNKITANVGVTLSTGTAQMIDTNTSMTSISIPFAVFNDKYFGALNGGYMVRVANIADDGFKSLENTTDLETIYVGGGISRIGKSAFENVSAKNVIFGEKSYKNFGLIIGENAFSKNYKVEDITLPERLKEIHKEAFLENKKLESVLYAGTLLDYVGDFAFKDCLLLESNEIIRDGGSNLRGTFGDGVFMNTNMPDDIIYSGILKYAGEGGVSPQITINAGIIQIAPYAFSGNSFLTGIKITSVSTNVKQFAFDGVGGQLNNIDVRTIPPTNFDTGAFDGLPATVKILVKENERAWKDKFGGIQGQFEVVE